MAASQSRRGVGQVFRDGLQIVFLMMFGYSLAGVADARISVKELVGRGSSASKPNSSRLADAGE
jgi:hypothetical protein